MKNLKLRFKILGGYTCNFWMTTALVFLSIFNLTAIGEKSGAIAHISLPSVYIMGQIRAASALNYVNLSELILADKKEREHYIEELKNSSITIGNLYKEYEKLISTEDERKLYQLTAEHRKKWLAARTEIVELVTAGKTDEAQRVFLGNANKVFNDYRDNIGALCDLNKHSGDAIAAQVREQVGTASAFLWSGVGVTFILAFSASLLICRTITAPIKMLMTHVANISKGNLDSRCGYESRDEIGLLAASMDGMANELKSAHAHEHEIVANDARARTILQDKVDAILNVVRAVGAGDLTQRVPVAGSDSIGQLGEGIEKLIVDLHENMTQISQNAQSLSAASEELSATAQQMASTSEETTSQATTVSAASEQVGKNVQTVAAGAQEMADSINAIALNANESAKVAGNAVRAAEQANNIIGQLGTSSAEIGKVIKVITSIAQQTNLLALNATIEAARAGAAGKGFAVVASEVKELAKETARATEDISRKIEAIQSDTTMAVNAIQEVDSVIGQINEISSTIAGAVERQNATTHEIGRNVAEAAKGIDDISHNMAGMAQAAQNTSSGASDSQRAATSLAEMAAKLQHLVSQFKLDGRDVRRSASNSQRPEETAPNSARVAQDARLSIRSGGANSYVNRMARLCNV